MTDNDLAHDVSCATTTAILDSESHLLRPEVHAELPAQVSSATARPNGCPCRAVEGEALFTLGEWIFFGIGVALGGLASLIVGLWLWSPRFAVAAGAVMLLGLVAAAAAGALGMLAKGTQWYLEACEATED